MKIELKIEIDIDREKKPPYQIDEDILRLQNMVRAISKFIEEDKKP